MSKICSFKRDFSEILPLQKACQLCYEAEKGPGGQTRFVLSCSGDRAEREELCLRGLGEECAAQLVRFLYENAVLLANWKEILTQSLELYMNEDCLPGQDPPGKGL